MSLAVASVIWPLAACSSGEGRTVTVQLDVSDAGLYMLDGVAVPKEELKHAVRAKRPQVGTLLLHVAASPNASFEAVGHAMRAAQYAGAQVAFVVDGQP